MSERDGSTNVPANGSFQVHLDIKSDCIKESCLESVKWESEVSGHIIRLAELSYSMEMDRYRSLLQAGSNLLTAISILSVVYIAALDFIFSGNHTSASFDFRWQRAMLVAFGLLLFSFLFALASSYRYGYKELSSPSVVKSHILKESDEYKEEFAFGKSFADSLEGPYLSINKRNSRISLFQRCSTLFLASSCIIFALSLVILL